ncbi:hypothetical protein SprV_0501748900 [Sparganum proliferum]
MAHGTSPPRGDDGASILLGLMFSVILMDVYRGERPGVCSAHSIDGHFNSRRMQARTRPSTTTVHDMLLVSNCALTITTDVNMQRNMDPLPDECANFGLNINITKTVVMHQPSPNAEYNSPRITVNGNQSHSMDNFAYLGGKLSCSRRIDDEVVHQTSKASKAFN